MKYPVTDVNKLKRSAKKASYDKDVIHTILDETEICHVAFNFDGKAFVQPINFGRDGEKIYLHGSHQNRMTQAIIDAKEVCVNVMLLT